MAIKPNVKLDLAAFAKDARRLKDREYPQKVALGFKELAMDARDKARDETRQKFKLHSDYIPNGILSTPFSVSQVSKASRSVRKYGDLTAAVFLRPASTPHKDLGFMVNHETGEDKTGTNGKMLAVPSHDIKLYSYKTSRGMVKKAWKPRKLLEEYNRLGSNRKGARLQKDGPKGRRRPFVMVTRRGDIAIARRKTGKARPLQFLYHFEEKANIKPRWGFERVIEDAVVRTYRDTLAKKLNPVLK